MSIHYKNNPRHTVLLSVTLLSVFFITILIVSLLSEHYSGKSVWKNLTPSGDDNFWCERNRVTEFLIEPMNSWSDFSFLFVGLLMLYYGISDTFFKDPTIVPKNMLIRHPILTMISAFVNIFHSFGTFTNHACRCWIGYQLDVTGMYLVIMMPVFHNLLHIHKNHRSSPVFSQPSLNIALAAYFALGGFFFFSTYIVADPGFIVILLLATLFFSYKRRFAQEKTKVLHKKLLFVGVGALILGYACWLLDKHRLVCFPESSLQLHGVWHVLTSISLLSLFLYQRSEGFNSIQFTVFIEKVAIL